MSNRKSSGREDSAKNPAVPPPSTASHQATGVIQRRLQEVQHARLATRLRELGSARDTIRALGVDPDQYASGLAKQYADLSQKLRDPAPLQPSGPPQGL